jgi:PAS domain S-box-containing protein
MTLTTRLAIAMMLLVTATVSAVGWLSYRNTERVILPRVFDRIASHSRLVAGEFASYAASAPGDTGGRRAAASVLGLIRAHRAGGIDPIDGVTEQVWRGRAALRLKTELDAKPAYEAFRVIALDDGGRELVRIDRRTPDRTARIVPEQDLQQKGERAYLKETVALGPNELYVSPLDLTGDSMIMEEPVRPTLRVAAPLFTEDGKAFGIFIVNINMAPAIERVRSSAQEGGTIYLVNGRGDYLVHPDQTREFGAQRDPASDWRKDFPELAALSGAQQSFARAGTDIAGQPSTVAFAPAVLAGREWVAVIETVPNEIAMAPALAIRDTSLLVGLIAVFCAAGLAALVARTLTRPIVQLTAAVESAGSDNAAAIPLDAAFETGVLARAFARVMGEASAKAAALEREVQEHLRTEAAREQLAEREHLFSAAVESSNDAIITKTLDGTITGWNPAAERLFGYAVAEAVGRRIDIIVPPERTPEVRDILQRIRRGERISHFETVRARKDGRAVEVSLSISPLRTPSGAIVGASEIAQDITERRRFQRALNQEIEERRRIFETSQDLIAVFDSRGTLVQISPSCETILGYRPDQVLGRSGADFIHPDDQEISREFVRRARRGEHPRMSDARCIHADGRIVWLSWLGTWSEPVRRYFFVGRDMTEARRAQKTLRDSEQLARGIIDTALDAFVQTDEGGVILDWNSQAERIFGWPRQQALGKNFIDLAVVGSDYGEIVSGLPRFMGSGQDRMIGRRRNIAARRCDGNEFQAEVSVTALKREEGFVFNGFFRDLTDKIAAEERLRQAAKMEALGQLTGGIAHDFNNILTVITGTIEILTDAVADDPQLAAVARMIDDAAARGAELTQHLLAFARRQPLQPRDTDVNTLIIDTIKMLRPALGEQIEIESVFEQEACVATIDPNQLAAAILNLSLNARDAMPAGGKLILETAIAFLDESYASRHSDVRPGRFVMIAVSDTGSGIAADMLDMVFDPFFTSKGPGKGTGLGLSMVYGFVKQSAGHIKIYSEEGHGTTIKMYLPPGTGDLPAETSAASPAVRGGQETILVVEDDKLVRDYVLTQLHSLGYVTLDAANAAQALAIVDAGQPFDLLFTDVIMPGSMNGRQLAVEIDQRRPGSKVLYTSGYTENAIIHHGRLDSGVLLLAKPYRKSDLAMMIRKALAG